MADESHWNAAYEKPLEQVPWEIGVPPTELLELLEDGRLKRCPALDVGCGSGNYAIFLARKGFRVTAVDFSGKALEIARRKAKQAGLKIDFIKCDCREISQKTPKKFGFILDYSLLHHLPLEETEKYALQMAKLLVPGGRLLLVCYSEEEEDAKGQRTRIGKYGNEMHYRTAEEIRNAFVGAAGLREIFYKPARLGKRSQHAAHCFLFESAIE